MPIIKPTSMAQYNYVRLKLDLYSKLAVAQAQIASDDRGRTLDQVMKDIYQRLDDRSEGSSD